MARESSMMVGSGLYHAKQNLPPNQTTGEKYLTGTSVVVLNPEDHSAGAGRASQITVSGVAVQLPIAPLPYRRAIAIRNVGSGTLYIGFNADVDSVSGFPVMANESLPMDVNGGLQVWGVTPTPLDVRILELS